MDDDYKPTCGSDKSQVNMFHWSGWVSVSLAGQTKIVGHFLFTRGSSGVKKRQFKTPYFEYQWRVRAWCHNWWLDVALSRLLSANKWNLWSSHKHWPCQISHYLHFLPKQCLKGETILVLLSSSWLPYDIGVTLHSPVDRVTWRAIHIPTLPSLCTLVKV